MSAVSGLSASVPIVSQPDMPGIRRSIRIRLGARWVADSTCRCGRAGRVPVGLEHRREHLDHLGVVVADAYGV